MTLDAPPLGLALPHNVGASRALPPEIVREIESLAVGDRLVRHLLVEFIRSSGMNGPAGHESQIQLRLQAELVITGGSDAAGVVEG